MREVKDLPEMVGELLQMSKDYLRQEALGPARRLGRVAGYGVGAGVAFAIGGVLWAVVGMRALARGLPDGWDWSAYVMAAAVLAVVVAGVVAAARR